MPSLKPFLYKIDNKMRPKIFRRDNTRTSHVQLDTEKCKACWKCLEDCPNQVIGKVDLLWHNHALIINPDNCTGCLKCMKACPQNAFSRSDNSKLEPEKQKKKSLNKFTINLALLFSAVVMVLSGLILQLGFHMGEHRGSDRGVPSRLILYKQSGGIDTSKIVFGLNYHDWSVTHKFAIVFVLLLMIYHTYTHWKWVKAVINKHLIRKNTQVITLSVFFLMTAITGLVPWFVDLSGSTNVLRLIFIEIHDKLALILIVYLFLHIYGRRKLLFLVK
jgi:2-oxoglutarate ferredoxin oxidoreductase subunit delta